MNHAAAITLFGPGRAELGKSLLFSLLNCGNCFLLWPETYAGQTRTGDAEPRFRSETENGTERNGPYPQVK